MAIEALYSVVPSAVFHGGTAIWRCYNGNRFSDDLDLYLRTSTEVRRFRDNFSRALKRYDAEVNKASTIGDFTIMEVKKEEATLKIEIGPAKKQLKPVERNYERADGTFLSVLTLSQEDFVYEKMHTYSRRRYIRDFYDIYHLSSLVAPDPKIRRAVRKFLQDLEDPIDENILPSIVYAGSVPSFEGMVNEVRRRFC